MAVSAVGAWSAFEREVAAKRALLAGSASVYAAAMADAVASEDRRGVMLHLRGVRDLPGVLHAQVQGPSGALAEIGSGVLLLHRDGAAAEMSMLEIYRARALQVDKTIVRGGRTVGRLSFLADTQDLRDTLASRLRDAATGALLAVGLGLLAVQVFVSRLTAPLQDLAARMAFVGERGEFDQEMPLGANDETGVLAAAFNRMLGGIRDRDARIARHMETLEETVELRTRDLNRAKTEAETANAAKSDFLATMSHEIRTPMNGMLVMAELLASADLSPRHRRYADIIQRSGEGLLAIINDILDLSKIESGKLEIEAVPFSIDDLVDNTACLFWERAREKSLELAVYIAPDIPTALIGDPTRLGQVLTNLVNNALKFTETGGVEIRISRADDALRIEVEDTGVGIPADKLETIFNAFSQADQSTTRRFGGTGLGLAVCRRLVDAMGGTIAVRSQVGAGATFEVRLPLACAEPSPYSAAVGAGRTVAIAGLGPLQSKALEQAFAGLGARVVALNVSELGGATRETADLVITASSALDRSAGGPGGPPILCAADIGDSRVDELIRRGAAARALPLPPTRAALADALGRIETGDWRVEASLADVSAAPGQFNGWRVLAADDNAVNREVLREALATLGVDADFVEDGRAAVEAAESGRFDAILMDGSMPEMDGYEAARRIRAAGDATPIIALKAQVAGLGADAWREAGMNAHVAKPFTIDRLAQALAGTAAQPRPEPQPSLIAADLDIEVLDQATLAMLTNTGARTGRDLLSKVWSMFEAKAPDAIAKVQAAVAEGDAIATAQAAHALKSMCLSVGAAQLAQTAQGIEAAAKSDSGIGSAPDRLTSDFRATAAAMEDYSRCRNSTGQVIGSER